MRRRHQQARRRRLRDLRHLHYMVRLQWTGTGLSSPWDRRPARCREPIRWGIPQSASESCRNIREHQRSSSRRRYRQGQAANFYLNYAPPEGYIE